MEAVVKALGVDVTLGLLNEEDIARRAQYFGSNMRAPVEARSKE